MLKARIQNGNQFIEPKLPMDKFSLNHNLYEIGIRERANKVKLIGTDDASYKVELSSDSDFGKSLIMLFDEDYTLDDINTCANKLQDARPEVLEAIENDILYEQYKSPEELMEDIENRTSELINVYVDYYCPLKVELMEDDVNEPMEVDNGYALSYEDNIKDRLREEQDDDLHDMAFYFSGSDSAKLKLISAVWDVEEVNGILYGVIHAGLTEKLTPEEEKEWVNELIGQAADGFGEGFEQRGIPIDEGEIFISFWHPGDDYFMENQDKFQRRTTDEQNMGIQIGGM